MIQGLHKGDTDGAGTVSTHTTGTAKTAVARGQSAGTGPKNDQHVRRQHQKAAETGNADDVGECKLTCATSFHWHKQEACETEQAAQGTPMT